VIPPLLPVSSSPSTLSLATLSKKERRQQFEAQVKAHDELLQQQAAAVAEQQQQQQQPQVPDTTFYQAGSTAIGYQEHTALGFTTDSGLGLSYPVDPDQSQLYTDVGLVTPDLFFSDQSAYQCKCSYGFSLSVISSVICIII